MSLALSQTLDVGVLHEGLLEVGSVFAVSRQKEHFTLGLAGLDVQESAAQTQGCYLQVVQQIALSRVAAVRTEKERGMQFCGRVELEVHVVELFDGLARVDLDPL